MQTIIKFKNEPRDNGSNILVLTTGIFYINIVFLPFPATETILYGYNT